MSHAHSQIHGDPNAKQGSILEEHASNRHLQFKFNSITHPVDWGDWRGLRGPIVFRNRVQSKLIVDSHLLELLSMIA